MQEVLPGFRAAFGSLLPRTESTPLFLDKVLSNYLSSVSSFDGPLAARDPGIDQGIPEA